MVEVAVLLEKVDGSRLSDKVTENSPSNYNLNVSLSEKTRSTDVLVLNFQLELSAPQNTAKMTVAGTATVKGTKDEIQASITAPDDSHPPQVLLTIYEKVYGLLYLVASGLKVPPPLPNLLKKTG
jgi:hypothetical protein